MKRETPKERLIFVSHSGEDTYIAKKIAEDIAARGAITFLDAAHIDAGFDFEEEIRTSLERADELVVLLTPWALNRPYVWIELGVAWMRRIPIIALVLGMAPNDLQARPRVPILLKQRNVLHLNQIDVYLDQLALRIRKSHT